MASPTVVGTPAETAIATASTSHVVNLPSGAAGNMFVAIMSKGSAGTTPSVNALAGWNELLDEAIVLGLYIAVKECDGTEGATTTFTLSSATRGAWIVYEVTGQAPYATQAPQVGTTATGSSVSPNPPSVSVTGGSKDILTIACFGRDGENADNDTWVTAAPSTPAAFSNLLQKTCGTAGVNLAGLVATAQLASTASAIDPGVFTCTTGAWRAQTIVIHPAPPTQTSVARISLASADTPVTRTGHSIKVRARVTSGTGTIRAALYEGASNRSGDLESSALTTSLADYTLAIPDASAANITDYRDLEIRLWGYSASGGARVFEVDQLWLETPEGITPTARGSGRSQRPGQPHELLRRRLPAPAQDFTNTNIAGAVTHTATIGGAVAAGPATTQAVVAVNPTTGSVAGGRAPLPQAIPSRGASTGAGTTTTAAVVAVTIQGAPASGNSPFPQAILGTQGAVAGGTGPTTNTTVTSQGAPAAGNTPAPQVFPARGGSLGGGTGPAPNAVLTSQGATAAGLYGTGVATVSIGSSTGNGTAPVPTAPITSQGAVGSGANTTASSSTVTAGGGVGFGTSPNPDATVPQGGAPAPGTGPGAVVILTSQGAVAGGPAPTDSAGVAETPAPGGAIGSGRGPLAVVGLTSQGATAAGQTPLPQTVLASQGALGQGRPASPSSSPAPGGGTADDGTILPTVAVTSQGAPATGRAPGAVVVVGRGAAVAGGTAPTESYFEVPGRGGAIGSGNAPTINATSATGGSVAGGPNQSATISIAPGAGSANGNGPTAVVVFGPGSATGAGNAPNENQSETAIGGAVASGNDSTAVVSLTAGEALAGGHAPSAPLSEQPDIGSSTASGNAPAAAVPPDQGGSTTISTGPTAYVTFAPGAAIGAGNAPTEIGVTPPAPVGPTPGSGNSKRVRVLHNRIEILDEIRDEDEEEALLLLGLSLE